MDNRISVANDFFTTHANFNMSEKINATACILREVLGRQGFRTLNRDYLLASMYVSRDVPIAKSTWIQGMPRDKVTSLVGDCAKMRPTP